MKRLTLPSLFVVLTLMLSSCSMHLGLSKILGSGSSSSTSVVKTSATKHVKATHTPPSPPSTADSIKVTGSGFEPTTLTVKVGTTVSWTNNDTAAESVTSDTTNLFDSGSLVPGAAFKHTFAQAGTFTYHSTNTPTDTGTIVVTP